MFKLLVTDPQGSSFEFPIDKDEIKIGRNINKNDLVLPSRQVSVQHALLMVQPSECLLKDLNSTNGIFINGQRITEQLLQTGDKFVIANYQIQLVLDNGEAPVVVEEKVSGEKLVRSISVFKNIREDLIARPAPTNQRAILELKLKEKVKILEMLYDFGKMLCSEFNLDTIFNKIVEICFQLTPTERCAILLYDEQLAFLEPTLISFRPDMDESLAQHTLNISQTITSKVIKEKIALLAEDIQGDERFSAAESIFSQGVHSIMCVPLLGKQRVLGVLYLDKIGLAKPFTSDDLDLLSAVGTQAAIALDNAVAYAQLSQDAVLRANYRRFLPNYVVDLMMQSPDKFRLNAGVTQQVTVLFVGMRNFTQLVEKTQPEIVIDVVNRFLSAITEIVFAYGGTLDKFVGDGLMALFGAPYQNPEDAVNAVKAATTMQRRMRKLNNDLAHYKLAPLQVGIGLSIGEAVVGYIGSEMRMDYTAIGHTVNLSARLMQQAKGGQILISRDIQTRLSSDFMTREVKGINIKGVSNVPTIFEVVY